MLRVQPFSGLSVAGFCLCWLPGPSVYGLPLTKGLCWTAPGPCCGPRVYGLPLTKGLCWTAPGPCCGPSVYGLPLTEGLCWTAPGPCCGPSVHGLPLTKGLCWTAPGPCCRPHPHSSCSARCQLMLGQLMLGHSSCLATAHARPQLMLGQVPGLCRLWRARFVKAQRLVPGHPHFFAWPARS